MRILLLALLLMNCIPNPLVSDNFDKHADFSTTTIKGTLYTKDLIENPGIWYWVIPAQDARKVYVDGRELEEGYGYKLKGDTVIIFEVLGVESVNYKIL